MRAILWLISTICVKICIGQNYYNPPLYYPADIEVYHHPTGYTTPLPEFINGSDIVVPDIQHTPDFRVEEPKFTAFTSAIIEYERPYRLSPFKKQAYSWPAQEKAEQFGCYCCTVYKRLILLAGCAVITTRHILTTATSTELVLRNYRDEPNLEGILGAWYDTDNYNVFNSSMYTTPARIHYHPKYMYDYEVNASHPIPCVYDLAIWAATYRFQGYFMSFYGAVICQRAVSSWRAYQDSIPRPGDQYVVIGFMFMKAWDRRPLPWFKYGIRTKQFIAPCPKTEWNWFHCIKGGWATYGMDSGAGLQFQDRDRTWRIDGMVGLGAFSMHLRTIELTHYFTVLDTYPVLDFLYYAMMAYQKYTYLDHRFEDSRFRAPMLYWGEYIPNDYVYGKDYCAYWPPNYRR